MFETKVYNLQLFCRDANSDDDDDDDVIDLSDDDPFNVTSSRKPAPTKKTVPKSRGITFESDSDEDIMPVKKRKR